ncbi:MAG: hypothetical protein GF364_00745 [Candidatus Lokiarchaeota archaeon]|nr:hypothetical protein [Candidatus Lokiarchaeota archaeon]
MKHKSSHQFMTKMLSYQGLFVVLPYILLHITKLGNNSLSDNGLTGIIIFLVCLFVFIIVIDYTALKTRKLDINSRIITMVLSYIAAFALITLGFLTYSIWDNQNNNVLITICAISGCYVLMGWFFIREDKTVKPSKEDKPLRSSAHCFAFCAITWGAGYLVEESAIIFVLVISLLCYPLVVILGDKKLVADESEIIKPGKLAVREDMVALTDFAVDLGKVIALVLTFIVFSYNGEYVLYISEGLSNQALLWRNLMWVSVSASFTALIFEKLENMIYGKFLIVLVLISAFVQSLFSFLNYSDQWLIFSLLNGITLVGVMTFVEQKITKSPNVRILPGMMFFVIYSVQLAALIINDISGVFEFIDYARVFISVVGLLYAYYRIKIEEDTPDLKSQGVRFSPLGIKYSQIPDEDSNEKK